MIVINDIFMCFPNGKRKALTLSYDDGVEQDIRLVKLMEQYGIKGTFNINSGLYAPEGNTYEKGTIHRRMSKSQCQLLFKSNNVEVASHTLEHPDLPPLPTAMMMSQLIDDRKNLEEEYSKVIRGFAYPFGTYSDEAVEVLRLAGISYARTTVANYSFNLPKDWLRLETTCHHKDERLMELAENFINNTPARNPYLFYLWGHSYEFEADDNWNLIERFFETVSEKNDIWYATNIEIYDYIQAYSALKFSADGRFIQNLSSLEIWCQYNNDIIKIPSGSTIETSNLNG